LFRTGASRRNRDGFFFFRFLFNLLSFYDRLFFDLVGDNEFLKSEEFFL